MKRSTPSAFAVVSRCALMAAAVALLFCKASSSEPETPPARSAAEREASRKPARSDRLGTKSRRNKNEKPPLSPAAGELLDELTRTIAQDQDGRILLKECREAGVRGSDFLNQVSDLKARGPETNLWNLEIILEAVAEVDGQAMAAWYEQNVSIDFVGRHN
ncbi:hypothetical protein N9W62_00020 [Akkermansiaceae bacterium]|nr:hypothetical protein [Akkermansiaceae bacterium]